jgi:uncharacterized integral membrane protein
MLKCAIALIHLILCMFKGNPIVIEGFEIPFDGPLFLTILAIHVLAGLTCVVAGIIAMFSKKKKGQHSRAGTIYYWGLWIVFITASLMAFARWREDYHLFILGVISFLSAVIGRRSLRKKWKRWSIYHISGMGISYIFLLIAFYVDNGRFLPVWKDLNPIVYWLLPPVIGFPILIRTLLRNPLSKFYFTKQ